MPKENAIRDRLSKTLGVLEPGLTLVEVNHRLPNNAGGKGFIDILAKDHLGHFVIIELKRSKVSSRDALFEILKYMPLFRRHHGLGAHQIRCFIVSTTWHELRVPFSEFRRLCETQSEGFLIQVDDVGNVSSAERVTDFIGEEPCLPSRLHCAYLYTSDSARKKAIPLITKALKKAGVTGYLAFTIKYSGESTKVIYPIGFYLVPTRVKPDVLKKITAAARSVVKRIEGKEPEPYDLAYSVEDRVLEKVNNQLGKMFRSVDMELSIGTPDKFGTLLATGWEVTTVERIGPFESAKLLPDADVIALAKGFSGQNSVRFERMSSPKLKLDWADLRTKIDEVLDGNPTWTQGVKWFLDLVESKHTDATIFAKVYNLLLLPETLYHYAIKDTIDYVPQLAITVFTKDEKFEALLGSVVWDKKKVPKSTAEVFACCGGIFEFYTHYHMGSAWELDQELMSKHFLEYSIWHVKFWDGKGRYSKRVKIQQNGKISTRSGQPNPSSLDEYLGAAGPYLEELFAEIDRNVGR